MSKADVLGPWVRRFLLEYLAIQEQNRIERLVLCRGTHVALLGQPRQKPGNVSLTQLRRMPLVMKDDVPADPRHVRVFGATAVMAHPDRLAHAIKEFWLFGHVVACCEAGQTQNARDTRNAR